MAANDESVGYPEIGTNPTFVRLLRATHPRLATMTERDLAKKTERALVAVALGAATLIVCAGLFVFGIWSLRVWDKVRRALWGHALETGTICVFSVLYSPAQRDRVKAA